MNEIFVIKENFEKLNTQLKTFGKTKCKFYKQSKRNKHYFYCGHPSMSYGGLNRDDACKLITCPRILYGQEK